MIDRVNLSPNETYEFTTEGSQYVVVVSLAVGIEVLKGKNVLARLDWLETYSCPANTGSYIVRNPTDAFAVVLLVRYILL